MPAEIQNKILKHAGILTLWVNGRIDINNINLEQFKELLRDVFETDWQGDLDKLPFRKFYIYGLNEPFWHLRSRSIHARLVALRLFFLDDCLDQAAILGEWTDLLDFDKPGNIGLNAARCGSIAMLDLLVHERKVVTLWSEHAVMAARSGHLDMLKWLHERMPDGSWTGAVMDGAAKNGHLDCVKWLHANRAEGCTTNAMDHAAARGHLPIVKWLHKNRSEGCTTNAMDWAADTGSLGVIEFLHNNRTEGCTNNAIDSAAKRGHADVVDFLHKNRSEGNINNAARTAAKWGQLIVIQRIHALAPLAITVDVANEAAASGRILVLDWIFNNTSVRPTAEGVTQAVKCGHLRLLPWFRKRMPDMFSSHPMSLVGNKSADSVIDWFECDELPMFPGDVMELAIKERQIMVVKWLLQHLSSQEWHEGDLSLARELLGIA
ncbi:hypothetical protein HK105_204707 [Polyrhizophydium stewartii]|uniref:Ankyrin repeat protein n=1 Tax=Polyrhizophydium stewartii TaxID=2732419 RepID=A0ABR4N8A7_9FUNG